MNPVVYEIPPVLPTGPKPALIGEGIPIVKVVPGGPPPPPPGPPPPGICGIAPPVKSLLSLAEQLARKQLKEVGENEKPEKCPEMMLELKERLKRMRVQYSEEEDEETTPVEVEVTTEQVPESPTKKSKDSKFDFRTIFGLRKAPKLKSSLSDDSSTSSSSMTSSQVTSPTTEFGATKDKVVSSNLESPMPDSLPNYALRKVAMLPPKLTTEPMTLFPSQDKIGPPRRKFGVFMNGPLSIDSEATPAGPRVANSRLGANQVAEQIKAAIPESTIFSGSVSFYQSMKKIDSLITELGVLHDNRVPSNFESSSSTFLSNSGLNKMAMMPPMPTSPDHSTLSVLTSSPTQKKIEFEVGVPKDGVSTNYSFQQAPVIPPRSAKPALKPVIPQSPDTASLEFSALSSVTCSLSQENIASNAGILKDEKFVTDWESKSSTCLPTRYSLIKMPTLPLSIAKPVVEASGSFPESSNSSISFSVSSSHKRINSPTSEENLGTPGNDHCPNDLGLSSTGSCLANQGIQKKAPIKPFRSILKISSLDSPKSSSPDSTPPNLPTNESGVLKRDRFIADSESSSALLANYPLKKALMVPPSSDNPEPMTSESLPTTSNPATLIWRDPKPGFPSSSSSIAVPSSFKRRTMEQKFFEMVEKQKNE